MVLMKPIVVVVEIQSSVLKYCPEGTYFDGYGCYDCDYCLNTFDDSACSAESGLDCAGACGDDGGDGPEICEEGYCPEGTYWDGYSCYDCDYCLTVNDDSACPAESGQDCEGACGEAPVVDCDLGWSTCLFSLTLYDAQNGTNWYEGVQLVLIHVLKTQMFLN